jgi:hypothetical protein
VNGLLRERALWRCFASGAVADGPSESLKAWEKKARKECKGEDPYTKLAHDTQEVREPPRVLARFASFKKFSEEKFYACFSHK